MREPCQHSLPSWPSVKRTTDRSMWNRSLWLELPLHCGTQKRKLSQSNIYCSRKKISVANTRPMIWQLWFIKVESIMITVIVTNLLKIRYEGKNIGGWLIIADLSKSTIHECTSYMSVNRVWLCTSAEIHSFSTLHQGKRKKCFHTYSVGGRPLHNACTPSWRTIFTKASCRHADQSQFRFYFF